MKEPLQAARAVVMTESIQYARLPDDIVVVRVSGRGNHQNSLALRQVFEMTSADEKCPRYILDLDKCSTMDSTFLGVVASIGLRQQRVAGSKTVVVNTQPHVRQQLDMLGLKYVLDMRDVSTAPGVEAGKGGEGFAAVPTPEISKVDRIILMIEAHERLIDVNSQNEIKFRGVLQSLRESLDRNILD